MIFEKQITKNTFKDSLDIEFYKKSTLFDIEYKGVRTNRLYFKTSLSAVDMNLLYCIEFAIFYKTNKLGELKLINLQMKTKDDIILK